MPPRSGKTLLTTIFGATWYLGMNPDHSVFCVTYNAGTAGDFGREAKLVFQQFAPEIFGVELDPTSRSDNKWRIKNHDGGFYSIGWGGPITGKKVHLLLIEDLIKNDEEATSPRVRDKIWSWWDGTAAQRVQSNQEVQTKVCSIQTRWTTQDLNGRLIDHERAGGTMRWDKLILPALAENGDVVIDGQLVMKEGESLCPELLPLPYLLDCRRNRSRFWWNALYQQRPLTQDGILWGPELFPDDIFVDSWPKNLQYLVVAVDPATGMALRDGDYSAIVALGMDFRGQLFVTADLEKSGPVETNRMVLSGYTPVAFSPGLTTGDRATLGTLLELIGTYFEVPEGDLEAYALISAMGPTYLWFQLYELEKIAVTFGLSPERAADAVRKMADGSVRTMTWSHLSPEQVMDLVPVRPLREDDAAIRAMYRKRLPPFYQKLKG